MKEIVLFNKALASNTLSFSSVNEIAIKKGYIVHPDCCNKRVLQFLETLPNNLNSTFYKSWNQVTSKTRTEIAIDQIVSYIGHYVFGLSWNPSGECDKIEYTSLKQILPMSLNDLEENIYKLLSGVALSNDTIQNCIELCNEFNIKLNISLVKNKEAAMYLYKQTNTLPSRPEEMLRFLVFLKTGKTLVIKNKELIKLLNDGKSIENLVEKFGYDELSSVFIVSNPYF